MAEEQLDVSAIPGTALKVLLSPSEFFRGMPKEGGFLSPLVFMVAMGVLGGLLQAVLTIVVFRVAAGIMVGLASIIVLPILIGLFGFVGAAIGFVIWKLLGSQESYETAYRCVAYIAVLTPINTLVRPIPFAGPIVAAVLFAVYAVAASVEVHRIGSRKAWAVFGAIGTLAAIVGVTAQLAAIRLRADAAKWQGQMQAQIAELKRQAEEAKKAAERQLPPPPAK